MRRIFLDSSLIIAGCGSETGASHAVILMAKIGLFKPVLSLQVIEECERNLQKKLPKSLPGFRKNFQEISPEIVPNPSAQEIAPWIGLIEDKDAPILAAAIAVRVDRLLTLNTKDFTNEVAAQCGLVIQTPGQFIGEIRSIVTDQLG